MPELAADADVADLAQKMHPASAEPLHNRVVDKEFESDCVLNSDPSELHQILQYIKIQYSSVWLSFQKSGYTLAYVFLDESLKKLVERAGVKLEQQVPPLR